MTGSYDAPAESCVRFGFVWEDWHGALTLVLSAVAAFTLGQVTLQLMPPMRARFPRLPRLIVLVGWVCVSFALAGIVDAVGGREAAGHALIGVLIGFVAFRAVMFARALQRLRRRDDD